jgi:hypothetical protein
VLELDWSAWELRVEKLEHSDWLVRYAKLLRVRVQGFIQSWTRQYVFDWQRHTLELYSVFGHQASEKFPS